jgi:hypothetical protein
MEQQERLIKLTSWKLTIDTINEISTILMLEKAKLLTEFIIKPVENDWKTTVWGSIESMTV